jgi:hypothetical protein
MSTFWKVAIPVVIIVAAGAIWYFSQQSSVPLTVTTPSGASQSGTTANQSASGATGQAGSSSSAGSASSASAANSANSPTSISTTGTTDADISSDLNSVDGQINGMNSDSASADQSLNASNQ